MSSLFASPSELKEPSKRFGVRYNGTYHMPLLPGEKGTKSGGDWVPYGCTSVTEFVAAFEDTRALSVWEQAMGLIGLTMAPELYERATILVQRAQAEGANFERLRDYPELRDALVGAAHDQRKQERSIIGQAKTIARAGAAAERGTLRHEAWEHRGNLGQYIGTPTMVEQTKAVEHLIYSAGLSRVPGLEERVVRNVELGTAGRFDTILMSEHTGKLYISDLKTKVSQFHSYMTVDAQLAAYARSEWMLRTTGDSYELGPAQYVDQSRGVILHAPSDGTPPTLEIADLEAGWRTALLAKEVRAHRAYGRSAGRKQLTSEL